DELTMDLDELVPDGAVTVALTGQNGTGKSTLFSLALTPWRIPPHIDDPYAHFGSEGLRELFFSHGTEQYRSRIVYKQTPKTKNQKAFLHHQGPTGWEPYLMPDNTVSDSKASTYDRCLEHLLGAQSLFYLSAFRSQGAVKLSEYENAKALMEDLLSLHEPKHLRKKTKLVAREIRRAFEATKDAAAALEEKKEQTGTLALQISTIQNETPRLAEEKTAAASAVAIAQAELAAAATAEGENVRVRKQREDVEVQLAETRVRHRAEVIRVEGDILKGGERLEQAKNASITSHGRLEARKQSVENRAFRAEQLLLRKEEIDFAVQRVQTLNQTIPTTEAE
ncbi:unnamed protein product, partial [marine sediment metagenome]